MKKKSRPLTAIEIRALGAEILQKAQADDRPHVPFAARVEDAVVAVLLTNEVRKSFPVEVERVRLPKKGRSPGQQWIDGVRQEFGDLMHRAMKGLGDATPWEAKFLREMDGYYRRKELPSGRQIGKLREVVARLSSS